MTDLGRGETHPEGQFLPEGQPGYHMDSILRVCTDNTKSYVVFWAGTSYVHKSRKFTDTNYY